MSAVCLDVEGPYPVDYTTNKHGTKRIEADHGRRFFEDIPHLGSCHGCYVFAIRNRGLRAAYIGMAAHGFGQEVFTNDKLHKYNEALHEWTHGSPVFLFVVTPGRVRSRALIREVEQYLIRSAKRAWPDLLNVHHAGEDNWDISGVTSPHRGRRSEAEMSLVQLLKFDD
jgi:hypothetical protein